MIIGTFAQQPLAKMRPQEARAAGDEYPCFEMHLIQLHAGIVLMTGAQISMPEWQAAALDNKRF
jgi:hypothetical protein